MKLSTAIISKNNNIFIPINWNTYKDSLKEDLIVSNTMKGDLNTSNKRKYINPMTREKKVTDKESENYQHENP